MRIIVLSDLFWAPPSRLQTCRSTAVAKGEGEKGLGLGFRLGTNYPRPVNVYIRGRGVGRGHVKGRKNYVKQLSNCCRVGAIAKV